MRIDKYCSKMRTGKETLISRSVRLLRECGVDDITVITGYKSHLIRQDLKEKVAYIDNPFYQITNSIASLWLAREQLTGNVMLMNADLFFEKEIIDLALSQTKDVVMLSDSSRIETADFRFGVVGDRILKTGNKLTNDETHCEYIGVVRIAANFISTFKKQLESLLNEGDFNNWWEGVLYNFIEEDVSIFHADVKGVFWTEIDDLRDYERLKRWLLKTYSNQDSDGAVSAVMSVVEERCGEEINA